MGCISMAKENCEVINKYAADNNLELIQLNLGCGGRPIKNWINIDNYDYEKNDSSRSASLYDIKMDIRNLDCQKSTVDKILLVHVIEHFVRWETINLVRHYREKLKVGGQLIVEMPDLHECIKIYLSGKNAPHMKTPIGNINVGRTQFYGNQWDEIEYETHRYVWDIEEFTNMLKSEGFNIISANHEAIFHIKGRDMLVIAEKSDNLFE
jgi:predicted SAM-dependent methyltransferase